LAARAYILIETAVGKTHDVSEALKNLPAVAEADDLPGIGDLITNGMHSVPGIVKTVTCLSVGS